MPLLLLAIVALLLPACADATASPAPGPDMRGTITSVRHTPTPSAEPATPRAWILVEGVREPDTQVDRASIAITADTRLLVQRGAERLPVTLDALQVGQRVEARFTGPVRKSYPVQATAREVVILPATSG